MHIQEIVVDGFKSYAHRTVITGFDPHFNAITGLNGSGKSNILDSICFVLGITNLSQVRAGNLSELVYKQGQAGINKASVTIVFNNSDTANSPVGYDHCSEIAVTRQISIGGKSKYLINGKVSPANQVANLFHSVQLNVNNPHFLIMQGRITKVLNMKPDEILGMVEEAAGTRMYENKKVAALKTIEKKQKKVDEINAILQEEITPTLERLRGEKENYLKWSKNKADIERIERFVVASEYMRAKEALTKNEHEIDEMEALLNSKQNEADEFRKRVEEKETEMEEFSEQLNGEFGKAHKELKSAEEKLSKELVKVTSAWKNSVDNVTKAKDDLESAKELVRETENAAVLKQSEIQNDSKMIGKSKDAAAQAEAELERLTMEYQNMCAGISSQDSGEGMTLPDQISKAHSDANNADAKAKQAEMKINHIQKTIKSVEADMKKEEKSSAKLSDKRNKAAEKVESMKATLSSISFSPDEYNALENEKIELENTVGNLQEVVDTLTAQLEGRLAFNYSDPVRGFDRNKVKGVVAKLIRVKNPAHATALEVVAGGKLFQVVVDEAITGKALLSRGKLQRRVTIIPLDKIHSKRISNANATEARSIAQKMKSSASPAIELVGFDEEVRSAVEYVFGSTLVVDDSQSANKICDMIKTRTVTLDGDIYDPSGTISGGSKENIGTTLSKLTELTMSMEALGEQKERLNFVTQRLNELKSASKKYEDCVGKLELYEAELSSTEKHLSQTTYGILYEKFTKMKKEIEDAVIEAKNMKDEKQKKWDLYNELKEKEADLTRDRETKLKDIENRVKQSKKTLTELVENARKLESLSQTLELELESLQAEVVAAKEAVNVAEKVLEDANRTESDLQIKVGSIKSKYDEAKDATKNVEDRMTEVSSALKRLGQEKLSFTKKAESSQLEAKKMSIQVAKYKKDSGTAEKVIASLTNKFEWIEECKNEFGVAGGDYDFRVCDVNQLSQELEELQSKQTSLSKKINKKVMGMIEKAEAEYSELLRKRRVIENDKKKIQSVIEELDIKKKSELERTWVKVNRDFGSIFTTLLPGATSKLEPPEGMHAWEGLEVKVGFGGVWKESLSELSGGQRSLIALSLILALLLFKPAPMYILDEVDAALDLSHTQNIGNMLKTHFSQSQFIVVSLKEGMFNNANVIFRTKFVDGVSTVTRTIGIGASDKARALSESKHDAAGSKKKASGRRVTSMGKEN
mmetsp:Transcript_11685/g.21845  ORF Transcript_11685/g.21845 Transcript_11685/m.21845 type:complete len:1211 (-) Transcript_11685:2-3634(-)|eukprot:CAMPEP_0176481856 /NCGR_PEP_ID=MMETSP0200_2-20121128/3059_1 /TAXON_ID=947934 /ORGANISM="Chaetoceros sp., Strain GSL56" /LENGTH=1210 /DNA_ID=CAMNT_0017878121 /DNA_START=203 /DNA_END=3835 /DNA_ORIENTATION=+